MKKIKKVLLGFSILTAFNIFSVNSFAMKQNNNGKIIENNSKNNCINTNIKKKKYILGNSSKNNHINTNVKKKVYIYNRKNNDLNEAINTQQPSINSYETHEQELKKAINNDLNEAINTQQPSFDSYETHEQKLEAIDQELEQYLKTIDSYTEYLKASFQEFEEEKEDEQISEMFNSYYKRLISSFQNFEEFKKYLKELAQECEQYLELSNPYNENERNNNLNNSYNEVEKNNSLNSTICTEHAYDEE